MEKVAQHIYLAPEFDQSWDEGYYYADETGGLEGPFGTLAEAEEALAWYQLSLEIPNESD